MNYLRKADMFGQSIDFEENESKSLKSIQGAILTLIVLIITTIICFLFGQDLYLRANPVSRLSQSLITNSTVVVKEMPFLIAFTDPTGLVVSSDYFDVTYKTYSVDSKVRITTSSAPMIPCNSNNITKFKNLFVNTPCEGNLKCLCIDENDNAFYKNDYISPDSQFILVTAYPCNPAKRKCPADTGSLMKNFFIGAIMPNSFVNSNDFNSPVESIFRSNL